MHTGDGCKTKASRRRRLGASILTATLLLSGCGGADQPVDVIVQPANETSAAAEACVIPGFLVPATDVEVLGDLAPEDEAIVEWALERFAAIELRLKTPIQVHFDASRELCNGEPGRCLLFTDAPAKLFVCEAAGDTAARIDDKRLTMLHELAHVWHFAQGDGVNWPDLSETVGGQPSGPDVEWNDRMVERVADVISWGLMDNERRLARGEIPCQEMYQMFEAVTGHRPLPPVDPACVPDGV